MGRKLLLLSFLITFSTFAQDTDVQDAGDKALFSDAIGQNIRKYIRNSQLAYHDEDYERATFLYDSLVKHVILNTHLDNFKVKKRSGKKIDLAHFEKPMILMSTASWCTPAPGTFPALNQIADAYGSDIDFVVLFWDTKKNTRKASRELSKDVTVVYVDELENKHVDIIQNMKHSLGLPTCFLLDSDKKIIDIQRTIIHPYHIPYETSFEENYSAFFAGVQLLAPTITIRTELEVIGIDKN